MSVEANLKKRVIVCSHVIMSLRFKKMAYELVNAEPASDKLILIAIFRGRNR
jgi:hypothetical protein